MPLVSRCVCVFEAQGDSSKCRRTWITVGSGRKYETSCLWTEGWSLTALLPCSLMSQTLVQHRVYVSSTKTVWRKLPAMYRKCPLHAQFCMFSTMESMNLAIHIAREFSVVLQDNCGHRVCWKLTGTKEVKFSLCVGIADVIICRCRFLLRWLQWNQWISHTHWQENFL